MNSEKRLQLPKLRTVTIADATAVEEVLIPSDCVKFEIYVTTAEVVGYWAVEADQVLEATGNRRTIPAGEVGGADDLKLWDNGTLYIAASAAASVEVVIYNRA